MYRNNLEAADEVARQLRLRDIGGIIVIDFIDMEIQANREAVGGAFRDALARDKTRTQVFAISELGLVEMTRKRVSEGLVESMSATCPHVQRARLPRRRGAARGPRLGLGRARSSTTMGDPRMYAVIRTGGKQYRVEQGQRLEVERVGEPGADVELAPVLLVDGENVLATPAQLGKATVKARGRRAMRRARRSTGSRTRRSRTTAGGGATARSTR